jgi:hypothetical protein
MAHPAAGATAPHHATGADNPRGRGGQVGKEQKMKSPSHRDQHGDEVRSASNEKIARLRALRLSKEAADREAAELSAAAKRAEIKSRPRAARGAKSKPDAAAPPPQT